MPRLLKNLVWLLLLLFLTSCNDFTDIAQPATLPDCVATLSNTTVVGQSFVARHGGLDAFEIYLQPDTAAEGPLVLHLRASPIATTDILTSTVLLSPGAAAGYYRFPFTPILHSHSQYYYAFLQPMSGFAGAVQVPCGAAAAYTDGSLYEGDLPQNAQSSFKLHYAPTFIALDLALMGVGWLGYGAAALGILFFAGYTLVRGWARKVKGDFTVTLIMSVMAALAAWMTFLVWGDLVHLHVSSWSVRAWMGIAVVIGLYCFYKDQDLWRRRVYWVGSQPAATLLLWLIILIGIGFRLFLGRGMVMLPGSDTYHHTLIVQLFAEQGGLPDSYEPYAPLLSFTYHFGFHSIVALFRWLLGTELLLTTKTTALVLNGAIAATTALLSERLAGDRRAGVVSAALMSLIMVSPFCLLRWGRFTQTTGMLFLPLAILALNDEHPLAWKSAGLFIASMVFAHFRLFFFWGVWVALLGVVNLGLRRWEVFRQWVRKAFAAFVFCVPYLVRLVLNLVDVNDLKLYYPLLPGYNDVFQRLETPVVQFATNPITLGILLFGLLGVFIFKRHRLKVGLFAGWSGLLLVGASLEQLGIGGSFWELTTVVLTLAVPLAAIAGIGGVQWLRWRVFASRAVKVVLLIACGSFAWIALSDFPEILNSGPHYLDPGSHVDMEWIATQTAPDARFISASMEVEWSPGWIVGIDEGYWIPLLAHREAALPPMIYPHEFVDLQEIDQSVQICHTLNLLLQASRWEEIGQTLKAHDIDYLFLNTQFRDAAPETLELIAHLRPVYYRDHVLIFEVTE